jgi:hypothetical protein
MGGGIPVIPARSAHHPLDQRWRGFFAVRRLGLAAYGSLGSDRLFAAGRAGGADRAGPAGQPLHAHHRCLALVLPGRWATCTTAFFYGSVVDFIEVHIFSYHWPDFNVADSSIVTGASM